MEAWREELHEDLYHSFKGQEWKKHKYIRKEGNRYIYPEDIKPSSKSQKGWISDTVSSIGNAAATAATSAGTVVSNAATSVANAVSDIWNTIASAVGSTATDLYNSVSSAVSNAISEHKDEPNWPKQKGQSETHNQVGIAEKTNVPWNEKLNNYIKARLAIIGDDKARLSDLYTAVSYLTYKHLNSIGWISKPATTATPLHEGLDLASLAKAIDVDVSDLTEEDVAALTYALWGVLDAKIRGTKNPLVEGKGEIRYNLIDQIQGKPQQKQQLLNKINSNKDRLAPQNTASKTKNARSVAIKPNNKKLIHSDDDLYHHGILGQKWGIRRFQNPDGSLTEEGRKRYGYGESKDAATKYLQDHDRALSALDDIRRENGKDKQIKILKRGLKTTGLDASAAESYEHDEEDPILDAFKERKPEVWAQLFSMRDKVSAANIATLQLYDEAAAKLVGDRRLNKVETLAKREAVTDIANAISDENWQAIFRISANQRINKLSHSEDLYHHGIKDQRWGVRRFQNEDGSLTEAGRERYGISKKDTKWATKNRKKITDAAYKESKRELNEFATQLLKQDNAYKSNGRLSAATINAYNRKMAELMSQKASSIRSPEGRVINFVAKRGEIGVHMALSDAGYDISQLKNGVWDSGRIAYKKKTVDRVEG